MKFMPIFKEKIWGGQKIKDVLHKDFSPLPNCGESWEVSGVEGNQTMVANGFLAENELNELVEVYMGDLVGEKVYDYYGNQFPLLIKCIDAADKLSIQVHPNDELARRRHNTNGKTEMWYVLQADEDATITFGFEKAESKESYLEHVAANTLFDILHTTKVKSGDMFFIPAGKVHAIGKGVLLAEIQQTSDITYRIFDFNRVDTNGQPRQLHTAEATDAINFDDHNHETVAYQLKMNDIAPVVVSPYFTTNIIQLNRTIERVLAKIDSFVIYMCVEGEVDIMGEDHIEHLNMGECVLIPALFDDIRITPRTAEAKLLETYIDIISEE